MEKFLLLWFIITILGLVGLGIYFLWKQFQNYLDIHKRMGIFADIPTSLKNQAIYLNFINAKNYPKFWNIHEDHLKLYAMGTEIKAMFYKSSDVPGGYKIAYSSVLSNVEILSMIESMKYDTLEVSYDDGITKKHIKSLHDKASKKIARKLEETQMIMDVEIREQMFKEIISIGKLERHGAQELNENRIISHINEGRTTGTTMRYQAIIPPHNPMIEEFNFDPNVDSPYIYHVYEGKCYRLKTHFVGRIENLYEWDIINLEPGTIYAGLTFSFNKGKKILPSFSLYGITKDKHGQLPTIDDAQLAKPYEGQEGIDMWTEDDAIGYMGESLAHKTYAILIKKHYEDEYAEEYLALNRTHEYYDDYDWLKLGQETRELHIERNKRHKH